MLYAKQDAIIEAFEWNGEPSHLDANNIKYRQVFDEDIIVIPDPFTRDVWIEIHAGQYLYRRENGLWHRADKKWFELNFLRIELADERTEA